MSVDPAVQAQIDAAVEAGDPAMLPGRIREALETHKGCLLIDDLRVVATCRTALLPEGVTMADLQEPYFRLLCNRRDRR